MTPSLSIVVEAFAGSSIDRACVELCTLADRLGLVAKAQFNGVTLMAMPGGDPNALIQNWHTALSGKHRHKIATTHRPQADRNPEGEDPQGLRAEHENGGPLQADAPETRAIPIGSVEIEAAQERAA